MINTLFGFAYVLLGLIIIWVIALLLNVVVENVGGQRWMAVLCLLALAGVLSFIAATEGELSAYRVEQTR